MYIKRGENSEEVNDYIKTLSTQDDVVEFNNKITVEYNELMVDHPEVLQYISELDSQVSIAVGEKLANQVAIAGVMFSVCESMLFAQEAGLDVKQWLELGVPGGAGSVAMGTLGRRLLGCDYAPGFFVDHFVKDLGLCLEECKRMGLVLPGLALSEQIYRMAQAQGHGKDGTQVLLQVLAELSGKQWRAHA